MRNSLPLGGNEVLSSTFPSTSSFSTSQFSTRVSTANLMEDDEFMDAIPHRSITDRRTSHGTNQIKMKKFEKDRASLEFDSDDNDSNIRSNNDNNNNINRNDNNKKKKNNDGNNNNYNNNNNNNTNNDDSDNNSNIDNDDFSHYNHDISTIRKERRLLFTPEKLQSFCSISQCFLLLKPNSIPLENLTNILKKQEFYMSEDGVSTVLDYERDDQTSQNISGD